MPPRKAGGNTPPAREVVTCSREVITCARGVITCARNNYYVLM